MYLHTRHSAWEVSCCVTIRHVSNEFKSKLSSIKHSFQLSVTLVSFHGGLDHDTSCKNLLKQPVNKDNMYIHAVMYTPGDDELEDKCTSCYRETPTAQVAQGDYHHGCMRNICASRCQETPLEAIQYHNIKTILGAASYAYTPSSQSGCLHVYDGQLLWGV